jgi:ABC-type molybdate transport system substrate-binding protein
MIAGSEERPEVLAFYEYLRGPEAAEIFEAYGFGSASN